MTKQEKESPESLGSKKKKNCGRAGVQIRDVNQLIKQLTQMQKMMKKMKGGKMKKLLGSFGGGESLPDMSNMDPKQLAKLAKNFK